jgi:putative photosynthetic complex assembly protein
MSHHHDHQAPVIPRGALVGAAILLTVTICGAAWTRWTDNTVATAPDVAAVSTLELRFADRDDGAIVVLEGGAIESPATLAVLPAGNDGFVRGVLRALARQRRLADHDGSAPLALTRWADGRLSIADPLTGAVVEINGFGSDNVRAFERVIDAVRTAEGTASARPVIVREENEA